MEFYDAVRKRCSVRKFKTDPIPQDVLDRILEAARWSPSWANVQATRYILVTDPEIKKNLSNCLTEKNPATRAVETAPLVIGLCLVKGESGYYKGKALTSLEGQWGLFDAGLAAAQLTLAAAAEGLGTVHAGALNIEKGTEVLQVPDSAQLVELIPIGYPNQPFSSPKRKDISELVFKDTFGG